jgi:hypothetical protein
MLLLLLLGAVGIGLGAYQCISCGAFQDKWKQAPDPEQDDLMVGRWQGIWKSAGEMGSGELKAVITHVKDDTYHAEFHATYWGFMSYTAPVDLQVDKQPGKWTFTGQADLGIYGDFTYEGWSDGKTLYSTYSAETDTGAYRVQRVDQDTSGPD